VYSCDFPDECPLKPVQIVKLNFLVQSNNNYLSWARELEKVDDMTSLDLVTQYVWLCVVDHYVVTVLSHQAEKWFCLVNLLLYDGDFWERGVDVIVWHTVFEVSTAVLVVVVPHHYFFTPGYRTEANMDVLRREVKQQLLHWQVLSVCVVEADWTVNATSDQKLTIRGVSQFFYGFFELQKF